MIRGSETVTIIRKTANGFDSYGNPTELWQEIDVDEVLISWASGDEPVEVDSKPEIGKATLYFPSGTEIHPNDDFYFRDSFWAKDGRVQDWESPFVGMEVGPVVVVRQRNG